MKFTPEKTDQSPISEMMGKKPAQRKKADRIQVSVYFEGREKEQLEKLKASFNGLFSLGQLVSYLYCEELHKATPEQLKAHVLKKMGINP
jgi:hypothetical protein